jgi:integrase
VAGTATRTVGLLGGILTYAVEAGIIESNPAHGIRKPKDNVRKRRLSEAEYRILGRILRDAGKQEKYVTIVDFVRQLALTGCRRSEMIGPEMDGSGHRVELLAVGGQQGG